MSVRMYTLAGQRVRPGRDWDDWIDFFGRTNDPSVRKGLVEVML